MISNAVSLGSFTNINGRGNPVVKVLGKKGLVEDLVILLNNHINGYTLEPHILDTAHWNGEEQLPHLNNSIVIVTAVITTSMPLNISNFDKTVNKLRDFGSQVFVLFLLYGKEVSSPLRKLAYPYAEISYHRVGDSPANFTFTEECCDAIENFLNAQKKDENTPLQDKNTKHRVCFFFEV